MSRPSKRHPGFTGPHDARGWILVKGANGLGDRFKALANARLAARMTGRRVIVDWSDGWYAPVGVNAFPLLFHGPEIDVTLPPGAESTSVSPLLWRGRLNSALTAVVPFREGADGSRLGSVDLATAQRERAQILVYWNYMSELSRLRSAYAAQRSALRLAPKWALPRLALRELEPAPEIAARAEQFAGEHFRSTMIGVHVRATDKGSLAHHSLIEALLYSHGRARIFLATDNRDVVDEFRQRYDSVVTFDKWLPQTRTPIHFSGAPDLVLAAKEAVTELVLLSKCHLLVFDPWSGFTYWTRQKMAPHRLVAPGSLRSLVLAKTLLRCRAPWDRLTTWRVGP